MGRLKRYPARDTLRTPADAHLPPDTERQLSPGLTANLPSNNPFRNVAASPASSPITSTFSNIPHTAPERPTSRNPFLDKSEKQASSAVQVRTASPDKGTSSFIGRMPPTKPALTGHAVELFDNLAISEGLSTSTNSVPQSILQGEPLPYANRPAGSENMPPKLRNGLTHQPSRSQDDPNQRPRTGKSREPELDVFADPVSPENGRPRPRPRRNSDSSISSRMMNPEEERRRRERHRREREARHNRGDSRPRPGTSSRPKKPNKQLDIIDSLDVTSIYGTGLFHHDGPFDACNPHRNRKGSQRAPMQAFAKDSLNNSMGGSGPVNKEINFAQFHGRGAEGFTDYATSGAPNPPTAPKPLSEPFNYEPYAGSSVSMRNGNGMSAGIDRTSSFNPTARVDKIYGEESMGLGTTTHLEGAPAARTVIQRRESETDQIPGMSSGGLGRKRSLAQKIRGISNANRGAPFATSGRVHSPDGICEKPGTPTSPDAVQSAGGMPKIKETNPFFNDYDDAYERKGQRIQIAEQRNRNGSIGEGDKQVNARSRAMSSPKRAATGGVLERRVTNEGTGHGQSESNGGGGGFLSRVKSLKGGKRSRPERKD